MPKPDSVQPSYLNKLRKDRHTVTVFTTNGVRMSGKIVAFDQFVVILMVDGVAQMIYKHAISTIAPAKPFTWTEDDAKAGAEG